MMLLILLINIGIIEVSSSRSTEEVYENRKAEK